MRTLAEMLAGYLRSKKVEKVRDRHRLYLSDLGKCPRQVQYRLLGVTPDPRGQNTKDNETMMFSLAEHIEEDLMHALAKEGLLWGYQEDIPIPDRDNWGGRYDMIADYPEKRIIEVKTLNPNAFRYEFDYPSHHLQAWSYHHYLAESEHLTEYPLLVYFDRGSKANDPQELIVQPQTIVPIMDELDEARDMVLEHERKWPYKPECGPPRVEEGYLCPKLDKVLKSRSRGTQLKLEPDARCNAAYCDYHYTCMPDMGTETWGRRPDDQSPWVMTAVAENKKMMEYVNEQLT